MERLTLRRDALRPRRGLRPPVVLLHGLGHSTRHPSDVSRRAYVADVLAVDQPTAWLTVLRSFLDRLP
ncbi:hypothetical protein [Dactylosporangium sp. NPDC005555]|uniref:hypothetical protein n=1 Tax=Dactylosporangium sp. NPDC005555 TaxID=3154889 RepID=UPI0033B01BA7